MIGGGPAYAQEPPEDMQQDTPEAEAPQPEVPKQISTIMVEGNRLSVEFVDVNFGEIIRAISQKAGFRVEGSSPAFSKHVTTKFTDLDMDTGLVRLFSMVKESNYLISYDAKGSISKLKMPSAGASGRMPQTSYGIGASGGAPQTPISRLRRRRPGALPPPVPGAPLPVPQHTPPQPEENTENEDTSDE